MVPMMLAMWAVIALVALPWLRTDDRRPRSPVEQLDERLAVGQIGVEEYRQRRAELDRDARRIEAGRFVPPYKPAAGLMAPTDAGTAFRGDPVTMNKHRSDDDGPTQTLVGVSFENIFRSEEFLLAVGGLAAAGELRLQDAVTVVKDERGSTMVHETIDPSPGRSAFSGALWAGLFGLILGGPVGWIAGLAVGAGAGAVTAKVVDLGISDAWVAWFRDAVKPGTATVALLIENLDRDALVAEAARFTGAELVYSNLDEFTIDRIRTALEAPVLAAPATTT